MYDVYEYKDHSSNRSSFHVKGNDLGMILFCSDIEKDCQVFAFMMNQAEENMKKLEPKEALDIPNEFFTERYNRTMNNTKASLFYGKPVVFDKKKDEETKPPKQDLPRGGYF